MKLVNCWDYTQPYLLQMQDKSFNRILNEI